MDNKTIKERAEIQSVNLHLNPETYNEDKAKGYYEGYINGATEQREIDIEDAFRWMIDNLDSYVGEGGWMILDDDPSCETYAEVIARDFKKDIIKNGREL